MLGAHEAAGKDVFKALWQSTFDTGMTDAAGGLTDSGRLLEVC